jgi:hypothetical protein
MTVLSLDMAYRLYGAFVVKRHSLRSSFLFLIRNDHAARLRKEFLPGRAQADNCINPRGARPVSATLAPACLYSVDPQWTRTMMQ